MDNGSDLTSQTLFAKRFSQIAFLTQVGEFTPYQISTDSSGFETTPALHTHPKEEIEKLKKEVDFNELEIIFFYGIGLGHSYEVFRPWLEASAHRLLVYIEDDLAAIEAFSRCKNSEKICKDPKVHLHYFPSFSEGAIDMLVSSYPTHFLECYALEEYRKQDAKKVEELRREILRRSATTCALYSEALFSHLLAENLLENFPHLSSSFLANQWEGAFANVPAIICGAGPSLENHFEELRALKGKALIIAGGSAISALANKGVEPDLAIAFDPNREEFDRFWGSAPFSSPLIYGMRLSPEVFPLINNPLGYLRSDTGGSLERWWEEQVGIQGKAIGPDLGVEALSVTSLALAFAVSLGCNPITFVGVDLAFTEGKRYAGGIAEREEKDLAERGEDQRAVERLIPWKDQRGNEIVTSVKWLLESRCIGQYAKKHPHTAFYNCTEEGIGLESVPYHSLSSLSKNWHEQWDFEAMLHTHAQNSLLTGLHSSTRELFSTLQESLSRMLDLSKKGCTELETMKQRIGREDLPLKTGKMVLFESEMKSELAYRLFFPVLSRVIDQMVGRFSAQVIDEKTKRDYEWKVESTFWEQVHSMTDHLSKVVARKLVA